MARGFVNWLRTLGAPEDPVATDTSSAWSAMSLLKAIYGQIAGGGLQTALVASLAGTSSSSVAIGTGAKSFTASTGKSWQNGQWLNIASDADVSNFMNGIVTSYDSDTGALAVLVDNTGGSGTFADWIISLSGSQGETSTLAIGTVTTVASGQPATVTDVGTPGSPILDFEIPQGAPGAVSVSSTPTTGRIARFAGATSVEDAGAAISTDGTFGSNSDAKVPTEKAVKTYADGLITALKAGVSTAYDTLAEIAAGLLAKLDATNNLSDLTNVATARSNLGLVIGTNVQAYDAQLFSNIPQNSKSAAYTTVLTDGGRQIFHPAADTTPRTWTIDSNANVAYPIGTAITFVNETGAGTITIAITSDTLVFAGAGSTGSRTLAAGGMATALKITTTKWMISGAGLT